MTRAETIGLFAPGRRYFLTAFLTTNENSFSLRDKVNRRQARQGESPIGERRPPGGEGALGYKVNRRQARQGELRSKRRSSGGEGVNVTAVIGQAKKRRSEDPRFLAVMTTV